MCLSCFCFFIQHFSIIIAHIVIIPFKYRSKLCMNFSGLCHFSSSTKTPFQFWLAWSPFCLEPSCTFLDCLFFHTASFILGAGSDPLMMMEKQLWHGGGCSYTRHSFIIKWPVTSHWTNSLTYCFAATNDFWFSVPVTTSA